MAFATSVTAKSRTEGVPPPAPISATTCAAFAESGSSTTSLTTTLESTTQSDIAPPIRRDVRRRIREYAVFGGLFVPQLLRQFKPFRHGHFLRDLHRQPHLLVLRQVDRADRVERAVRVDRV